MSLKRGGPFSLVRAKAQGEFRARLLRWFEANARDLPWRRTRDPYAIWVSEIMLQQTRVAAVIERYSNFVKRFPTVAALSAASEAEVLALWSGLGYYRRARMMHRAARVVAEEYGQRLPSTAAELRKLPGIGSYTSAAIASIAFGEAVAVVDGNVERVMMRLMGWGEAAASPVYSPKAQPVKAAPAGALGARIQERATRLLDPTCAGEFNQSMMELGATVCLPRRPLCLQCPVYDYCETRGEHPVNPRSKMRSEEIAYALVRRTGRGRDGIGEQVLLEQRPDTATVMASMWELPSLALSLATPDRIVFKLRHAIMQTNYSATIAALSAAEVHLLPSTAAPRQWFAVEQLSLIPLTGLARKVLLRKSRAAR